MVGLLGGEPAGADIEATAPGRILADLAVIGKLADQEEGTEQQQMVEFLTRLLGGR